MQRRRFLELTTLSVTAVASTATAGCTGSAGAGGDPGTTTTTTSPTTSTTKEDSGPHNTTTVLPCPQVRDVSVHVCPGDDGGPISVDRSTRKIPADGGVLSITVTNTTDQTVGLNPYAWAVHRLDDKGHWQRVDERAHIEPWEELEPGARKEWRVASDADYETDGSAIACPVDLDPGTYGWTVELKPESRDGRVAAAVGFYVE